MEYCVENIKCVICKSTYVDKRIIDLQKDTITLITLCNDCFVKRIEPMIDEDESNLEYIIKWFKDRRLILHREVLIDSLEESYILSLAPGIYRIKITILDDLPSALSEYFDNDLIKNNEIGIRNKLYRDFISKHKDIEEKQYIHNAKIKNDHSEVIYDTNINPNLILRNEILKKQECPKCNSNLDLFLRQLVNGCGYCFVYFFDYIEEYVNSVKKKIEIQKEEENKKNNSYKSKLELLETIKEEAIKNNDWEAAANYRDQIRKIKNNKGKDNE